MRKIYFAGAVRGGREDVVLYEQIDCWLSWHNGQKLSKNLWPSTNFPRIFWKLEI